MEEEGHVIPENLIQERDSSEEEEGEDDDEEDDDDDGGWITPSNIRHMKESIRPQEQVKSDVCVGCITTDFAMQVSQLLAFSVFYSLCTSQFPLPCKGMAWPVIRSFSSFDFHITLTTLAYCSAIFPQEKTFPNLARFLLERIVY